ncbi:unnamed protein product, partial [Tetraodon nigroviridis]
SSTVGICSIKTALWQNCCHAEFAMLMWLQAPLALPYKYCNEEPGAT